MPSADADQIIKEMKDNFSKKREGGRDIVIIAPLIEKEAKDGRQGLCPEFLKRLEIGMPLQVDAVFPYITEEIYVR